MKNLFLTLFALLGMTMAMNAQTVDDIKPMLHSYVMVFDNYTGNGTVSRVKGALFGSDYFLDVTGGSLATNKGSIDIADPSTYAVTYGGAEADTARLASKYTTYGKHYNSLRLKNAQDVIALKPTAGSVIYVFGQGNKKTGSSARVPKFATDYLMQNALNEAPTDDYPASDSYVYKFVVPAWFDGNTPLYIGSYNGDAFFSFIVVEANEPAGTPSVEVGSMVYDEASKLYYQEVTCTPNNYTIDGVDLGPTQVYYTTDGTKPTEASTLYTKPIKCYKDMTVKFQAYWGGDICEGASNETIVEFNFDAPTLTVDEADATLFTEYRNATNYYSIDGAEGVAGDTYTATASCNFSGYTVIKNGEYATWTSPSVSSSIYVLQPIKEKKVLTITGTVVVDEEATALNPYEEIQYMAVDAKMLYNGKESDPSFYLVPDATFGAIMDPVAQADGQEVYLQMNKPNLTFKVAEGDSVNVKVTVSNNSHKNAEDLKTYVNVNGMTYGYDNILEGGNVIEFGLIGGTYTFQKYSGTGNIWVASIEITPVVAGDEGIEDEPITTSNSFSLSDVSVFSGSSFSFPVSMTNESEITAFQCDVYLPAGLMLNWNDEGEYDVVLNADRKTSTHSVAASLQPDGAIRIAAYSSANKLFKGNEGELFTLNLTALDGCAENQKIEIRNIRLSTPDQQEYLLPNVSSTVSVKSYTPADANGDGEVTIVDVVAVVNALMGDFSGNFIFDAADMDQNGEITIVDVVAVVNTLMGGDVQEETPQTAMDIQLETKDGQVIKNGSKVSVNAEMVDMMIWGQVESNIYVRNLTGKNQGVYASVKTISGDAQICWGGSCVPLSEGASHTTSMGLVSANSSASLLIESLVMESNYMSVPVTRTVEVTVWTDSKPEEKYTATVTYYYTPSYFDTNTRPVATRSNASILRSNLHVEDAEVNAGESTTLYVKLDNAQAYTAMQMDLALPEGLSIEGVEMMGNPAHAVAYSEEGRIAAYSLGNSRFSSGETLMAVTVKADDSFTGAANVGFTNVRVVSTDVVETILADAFSTVIGGSAKSIDGVMADDAVQIIYYTVDGAASDAPHKGLNIIKRIYENGRVEVDKVMNK